MTRQKQQIEQLPFCSRTRDTVLAQCIAEPQLIGSSGSASKNQQVSNGGVDNKDAENDMLKTLT